MTGGDVELMWVKGSGGDLGTLAGDGLAVLRLDRLRALVDAAHVDHLHPDAGIAIAADGPSLTERIFGDRVVWVPWCRPRRRALPLLRGLCSTDAPQVGHYTDATEMLDFVSRSELVRLAALGTSCPDHSCAPRSPCWSCPPPRSSRSRSSTRPTGRTAPPTTRATPLWIRLRYAAPIVLVPGVGMFSFGKDKQTARVAGEFYVNAINVMRGAESVSACSSRRVGAPLAPVPGRCPDRSRARHGGG